METTFRKQTSWARWLYSLCLMMVLQAIPLTAMAADEFKPATRSDGNENPSPGIYYSDDLIGPDHPAMKVVLPLVYSVEGYNYMATKISWVALTTKHGRTTLCQSIDFNAPSSSSNYLKLLQDWSYNIKEYPWSATQNTECEYSLGSSKGFIKIGGEDSYNINGNTFTGFVLSVVPEMLYIDGDVTLEVAVWYRQGTSVSQLQLFKADFTPKFDVKDLKLERNLSEELGIQGTVPANSARNYIVDLYNDAPAKESQPYRSIEAGFGASTFDDMGDPIHVSNKSAYTFYPVFRVKNTFNFKETNIIGGKNVSQQFAAYYGPQSFPAMSCPANLTVQTLNCYRKHMKLTWEKGGIDGCDTDGKWAIYRKGTQESQARYLGTTNFDVTEFTDEDANGLLEYGKEYTYYVSYIPKGWDKEQWELFNLSTSTTAEIERNFAFGTTDGDTPELYTTSEKNKGEIVFHWTHSAIEDAGSKSYKMYIERTLTPDDPSSWKEIATVDMNSAAVTDGFYTDRSGLELYETYYYRLRINVMNKDYTSTPVTGALQGGSELTAFSASRGTYTTSVQLKWNVNQVGSSKSYFVISRRPLGSTNEADFADIYTTSGTDDIYSYDDTRAYSGSYYEYKVSIYALHNGEKKGEMSLNTDGYCMQTGVLSGRIYYGTGTAVEGVKVHLNPNDGDGDKLNKFRSVNLSNEASYITYAPGYDKMSKLLGKDFAIQMYVNPTFGQEAGEEQGIITVPGALYVSLKAVEKDGETKYEVCYRTSANGEAKGLGVYVNAKQWNNLSLSYNQQDKALKAYIVNYTDGSLEPQFQTSADGEPTTLALTQPDDNGENGTQGISLGEAFGQSRHYNGLVDEFRLWTKALTLDDVKKNYYHTLSGSENKLAIYWPMDEGLENQVVAYDLSQTNDAANECHAVGSHATASTDVPAEHMLSLCTMTDADGNYVLRGVPFSGNGTNYVVTPVFGVHEFSPSSSSCYLSTNSMVHSGVDFKDASSFPVSGTVLYEGTTIPVEGAMLMVDGTLASKDGKAITTNSKGEFSVDVPIGDHFISLSMNGHTFVGEGRFPADPDGVGYRYTFEKAMSGLKFWDNTKVSVAGRVVGGDLENDKPLGVGAGNANLGKAVVNLTFNGSDRYYINAKEVVNGLVTSYEQNDEQHDFAQASDSVQSKAYVQGGKNVITIETDPKTGEWAAMLPPLKYEAQSITIPTQTDLDFTSKLGVIDASNAMAAFTDSIKTEQPGTDGYARFKYTAAYKVAYHSESSFDVIQESNGAYGEKEYAASTINGLDTIPLYTVNKEDGTIDYAFGAPVFVQYHKYGFKISGYEKYVNYDGKKPVIDKVPLAGVKVTAKNEMALSTSVVLATGEVHQVEGDEFELDSVGCANYVFTAGLPNLQAPYHRTMAFSYNIDGTELQWKGNGNFKAIVAGMLPQGNDFVTEGPDKPLMILRDPPGTASSATWARGHSKSTVTTYNNSINAGAGLNTTTKFGAKLATFVGLGVGVINEAETKCELDVGLEANYTYDHENTLSMTTTTTTEISTSDAPDYVGAAGDVYIGTSTNIVLGQCKDLSIKKNETTGEYGFSVDDILMSSEQFTTSFNYTQAYIEGSLIPNFEKQRDNLLVQVADVNSVARPAAGKDPLYVTTLSPDDKNFGTSNSDKAVWGDKAVTFGGTDLFKAGRWDGPSYSVILPIDCQDFSDKVQYYNSQVRNWQNMIARNEEAKVEAIKNRDRKGWLIDNYSFDSGSKVTYSVEEDTTRSVMDTNGFELNLSSAQRFGATFSGTGVDFEVSEHVNEAASWGHGRDESKNASFTFNLQEDGNNDYLSVDAINDNHFGYSPIFYTRAGATSGPYEDEVVTSYYKPGTIIQQKTLQIEKPEMSVLDPLVTGVPAGKEAKVRIKLRNMSETQSGLYYGLKVMPATNPNGAQIFMDGKNIATGIDILLQGGEEIQKTLTIRQSDEDILEYKDIVLRMYSLTQPEDGTGNFPGIYSDQTVSVFFQPSCTDIDLASTATLVNTDSDMPVTFSMSGYDYNQASFQEIRLQYKGENDANFKNLQVFVKDESRLAGDPNLKLFKALSGTEKLTYQFDLRSSDYSDQTYVFRAQTVGNRGGDKVTNESQEIRIVRDMNRPQLITNPTPANGVLSAGGNITLTFNEDINQGILTKTGNFIVTGKMNETEVAHDVALDLTGSGAAKTTATINLAQRPFAASMWLNYTTDGTIMQHGTTGNSFTASIRDGKLVLAIGDKEVVSTQSLPTGKWVFLAMNYDPSTGSGQASGDETPRVSASYALDADIVNLFIGNEFVEYEGNGPLTIGGNGLKAKVQEVTLWNEARDIEDALADRGKTKNPYTSGLIGYWQLGEGHGLTATDRARSRDLTLPAENAWYVGSGVNYAAKLDGQTAIESPVSTTATADDSYMVELWFNVTEKKADNQTIVSLGNKMDVSVNAKGQVVTTVNGNATTAYAADVCDGQWHHMAINVLKGSNGSATLYIDGQARRQFSAAQMPTLGGAAHIVLGAHEKAEAHAYDQFMTGSVDEVRVWNGRRTSDVVKNMMYQRVENDAEGLEAYYPMETRSLDDYGQVQTQSSAKNMKGNSALNMNGLDAEGFNKAFLFGTEAPALATAPALENVQFDFVASERQITINLGEEPYKMENCNVNLTVKNVKDLNGNAAQPITWTIFVQQNQLKWVENDVEIETVNGEAETFTVEIENHGATSDSWTLKDMPTWLTVNTESGNLAPQASQKLRFTVDPSTAVGNYEATVYLTGSQNIDAPLNITLKVKGEEPVWTPMPDEETMNIVAQVKVDGVVCADPDDMIGAFRGQECVGVAKPVYSARYDAYFVMLNIYGNKESEGATLNYKFYDASTGTIYPAVSASKEEAYTFHANAMVGSFGSDWTIFTPENKIEQDLSLNRTGWKWFSIYAAPDDASPAGIFADAAGKVTTLKDKSNSALYKDNVWGGTLSALNVNTMYKLQADEAYEETIIGTPAVASKVDIEIAPETWTWIGYPVAASNSLASAFADADPQDGDIVKSQSLFAMYVDGGWMGSLTAMTPGEGYKYYSSASGKKTFNYQTPASGNRRMVKKAQNDVLWLTSENNMAVIANVMMNGEIVRNAIVSVYAGEELCGYSTADDEEGRHFITVGSTENATRRLRFVIEAEGETYVLDGLMDFHTDAVMGTAKCPVNLNLDEETAIKTMAAEGAIERIEYFDLAGRLLLSDERPASITQSQRLSATEVALKRVVYTNGTVKVFKTVE